MNMYIHVGGYNHASNFPIFTLHDSYCGPFSYNRAQCVNQMKSQLIEEWEYCHLIFILRSDQSAVSTSSSLYSST